MDADLKGLTGSIVLPIAAQIRGQLGQPGPKQPILLVGAIGSGKTAAGLRLVSLLRSFGVRPGGILSPRILDGEETVGYSMIDLATNTTHPFAGLSPAEIAIGKYYISAQAQHLAERILHRAMDEHAVIFVDEVGQLELEGGGHAAALRRILPSACTPVLLVRDTLVESVMAAFGMEDPLIVRITDLRGNEDVTPGGAGTFWDIVDSIPYPLLITHAVEDRFPQSRPMHLVDHDRKTMWFATSRASRKVRQIALDDHVSVLFVDSARYNYAAFHGHARLVEDPVRQKSLWRHDWEESWPRGPSDPDYVLIRVDGAYGEYLRGHTGESGRIELA